MDDIISIKVYKSLRRLELYKGNYLIKAFSIVLGKCPEGKKTREGDDRTPEGLYYICTRNEKSKYHLFLGLSYPGITDAEDGMASKVIDAETFEKIINSIKEGHRPPWDTALGGTVGIHGGGTKNDWTAGCIALSNEDIEELWQYCPLNTPVLIEK